MPNAEAYAKYEKKTPNLDICSICDQVHSRKLRGGRIAPSCTAHQKRFKDHKVPCRSIPINGSSVCNNHGVKTVDKRRYALDSQLGRILVDSGFNEPVTNPLEEIGRLAGDMRAIVKTLEGKVDIDFINSGEMAAYERFLDRFGSLLINIGRLDIDGRLAKVEEAKLAIMVAALDYTLSRMGLDDRLEEGRRVFGQRIRMGIKAGGPPGPPQRQEIEGTLDKPGPQGAVGPD